MQYKFVLIAVFLLMWLPAAGQQNAQVIPSAGAELTAPVLLPPSATVSTPKHCDELDGVVKFAAMIDAAGLPESLKMLEASDRRLVGFAMELVEAQRFKPGTIDGSNTAVAVELTVGLHTCAQREKHPTDDNFYRFTQRAHPLIALAVVAPPATRAMVSTSHTEASTAEQVGGRISAPIPTLLTDPKIPVSGKLPKRGHCFLGLMIDANGVPQNIHLVRGLEPELDNNAMEAVKNWRFTPALRDGITPVAVEGTVVATFEYVEKEPVTFVNFIPETPEKVIAANADERKQHHTLEPVNADEVIARYMPQSRIAGRVLVSLVIDTNGVPQNVHIIKGLDSSLDVETAAMVEHLRFKPVMKDATTPVPVGIVIPVRYRMAVSKPTWRDVFFSLAELPILFLMM
jgi:TonB family protein